ncbi:uncharacterized protein PAN0_009c3757 [Moesziomyces antarcticus]|uniref:Uncharacterized protein n=1 Tax=Pseudozyma antarctica TaxID=84753 RepID=A0A081CFU4_PSEA2|nr:uncharacterized protein PAN0_009c3757 [Moesziomyces antarcticus]GAK65540.1 hypothetical protein PAN0_009c3757 [Moesziomyces antarcticus]
MQAEQKRPARWQQVGLGCTLASSKSHPDMAVAPTQKSCRIVPSAWTAPTLTSTSSSSLTVSMSKQKAMNTHTAKRNLARPSSAQATGYPIKAAFSKARAAEIGSECTVRPPPTRFTPTAPNPPPNPAGGAANRRVPGSNEIAMHRANSIVSPYPLKTHNQAKADAQHSISTFAAGAASIPYSRNLPHIHLEPSNSALARRQTRFSVIRVPRDIVQLAASAHTTMQRPDPDSLIGPDFANATASATIHQSEASLRESAALAEISIPTRHYKQHQQSICGQFRLLVALVSARLAVVPRKNVPIPESSEN